MSTLNFLNVITHLGGIRAKRQISGWRLAHVDDAFLQQSVRAGGVQTYFDINQSKTSLGKLLVQEKKRQQNDTIYSDVQYECFRFPVLFSPPFT